MFLHLCLMLLWYIPYYALFYSLCDGAIPAGQYFRMVQPVCLRLAQSLPFICLVAIFPLPLL